MFRSSFFRPYIASEGYTLRVCTLCQEGVFIYFSRSVPQGCGNLCILVQLSCTQEKAVDVLVVCYISFILCLTHG